MCEITVILFGTIFKSCQLQQPTSFISSNLMYRGEHDEKLWNIMSSESSSVSSSSMSWQYRSLRARNKYTNHQWMFSRSGHKTNLLPAPADMYL